VASLEKLERVRVGSQSRRYKVLVHRIQWTKTLQRSKFSPDDYLFFGRETAGLPKQLLEQNRDRWLRIPMFNAQSRSLNLSNCVALVLFEALRQQGFKSEIR